MRSASVSGISDSSQYFPTSHAIPRLHPHATGLQVRVVRELSATQTKSDAITQSGLHGYRHGDVKLPLYTLEGCPENHLCPLRHSRRRQQYWLAIGVVRAVVERIARKEHSIHALPPVDGPSASKRH